MQQDLFNQELVPLWVVANKARIEIIRYEGRNDNHTLDRILTATDKLAKAMEAILSGDPINLRLAGVTPAMALHLSDRLRRAAMAVRKP